MFTYKTIIFDLYGVITDKKYLYHGVNDLIAMLYKDGYTLCICTDENQQCTDKILKTFDIYQYFSIIKSYKECFIKAQRIKQILDECACCSAIIVGNGAIDINVAYNVKCQYIGAYYDEILDHDEKIETSVYSPIEIYDTIKKINKLSEDFTPVNLKDESIVLIPVQKKHITDINMMLEDDETREMLGVTTFPDETYYEDINNKCYVITDVDNNFIGVVELFDISWKNRRAELSIGIRPSCRGKGFAYKAIKMLIYLGFSEIGLNRIWLRVLEHNHKAISLYEKVGFIKEGVCREESLREGKFINQIQMSILRNEWLNSNDKLNWYNF